ncbi:unnamed protein product [Thelazia callipaeda]|uniref:TOG domain-containing protein n=1 Tax=Thelazia callipaeda TaxID=103827 RepID=A0A0N5CZG0_THECL|nr:unnamed protein product [Thelazia callipaeda]
MSWLIELLELNSPDPRQRLELGQQLLFQLQISNLTSDSRILNDFCDLLVQWLSGSNHKVASLAVEIMDKAVEVSGNVFGSYLLERITALVDRLGDAKQNVRDAMIHFLANFARKAHLSPQNILDKISFGLNHRQWLIRIGTMNVIKIIIEDYKRSVEPQISRMTPNICKLMNDPNMDVREVASRTLVAAFLNLSNQILEMIRRKQLISEPR